MAPSLSVVALHAGFRTVTASVLLLLLPLLVLSGCSPAQPALSGSGEPGPEVSSAVSTVDEVVVSAEVYRSRIDPSRGGIQLSLRNGGSLPLTVVGARLESATLVAPIVRERTTTIGPGLTRDLALTLTATTCPSNGRAPVTTPPTAVLTVLLADGSTGEVHLNTVDRIGQWAEWVTAECLTQAVADTVTLSVRHDPARDDGPLIGLALEVDPRGTSPARDVQLLSISDTVLFALVRASDGSRTPSEPLPAGLSGSERAVSIPLLITPARCDSHALADDKQGTLFRVSVTVDGRSGTVTIAADSETKARLYAAYTRACGL